MSTTDVRQEAARGRANLTNVAMKVEVMVVPVADVDRAKEFYARLGWRGTELPT